MQGMNPVRHHSFLKILVELEVLLEILYQHQSTFTEYIEYILLLSTRVIIAYMIDFIIWLFLSL